MDDVVRKETSIAAVRLAASCALLLATVMALSWALRGELSSFGVRFVERFGFLGLMVGSFLADSLHFPLPPQFYLLTGIVSGHAKSVVLASVLLGSQLGGLTAFAAARRFGRSPFLDIRFADSKRLLAGFIERRGYRGLAIAALLPISYWLLCIAGGALRLPYKAYGVLAVMRVPRILLSYAIIVLAWGAT